MRLVIYYYITNEGAKGGDFKPIEFYNGNKNHFELCEVASLLSHSTCISLIR